MEARLEEAAAAAVALERVLDGRRPVGERRCQAGDCRPAEMNPSEMAREPEAAREVIVGTLGTIYGMESDGETLELQDALRQDLTFGGQPHLTAITFEELALQNVFFQAFHLHTDC